MLPFKRLRVTGLAALAALLCRDAPAAAPVQPGPASGACGPSEDAAALHRRMRAEAGPAFALGKKETPLLVDRWPSPTAVVVITYDSTPLPTGMVAYAVSSPEWKLTVSSPGDRVVATHLHRARRLGRQVHVFEDERLAQLGRAEDVLLEVLAGCRSAESACEALGPYRSWADANSVIARHLARQPGIAIPCRP